MNFNKWFRSKIIYVTKPSIILLTIISYIGYWGLYTTKVYGFNLYLFLQIFLIGVCLNIIIIFKKRIHLILGLIGILVAIIGFLGLIFTVLSVTLSEFIWSLVFVSFFIGLASLTIIVFEAIIIIIIRRIQKNKGEIQERLISQESLEKLSGKEDVKKELYAAEERILEVKSIRKTETERFERVATKADFPERWALMYGKKPKEKENFRFFNEFELNIKPMLYHPIYFHLNLTNFLENLNYRIEVNNPPINDSHNSSYLSSTLLDGSIKASIRTSKKSLGATRMLLRLILGCFFMVFSIISIILVLEYFSSPDEDFLRLLFFSFFLISLTISLILLLPYIIDLIKGNRLKGYSNIYVLERGISYTGTKQVEKKINETTEIQKMPLIATKLTISIAGAAKLTSVDRLKEDIEKLSKTIENLYNSIQ